ncbi:MAG: hypothetical protein MJA27_16225 [Pseudanabaenales cyanobacterium]|nr:hypothetical protein [Pseudanabaenales cyanobacterium]
MANASSIVLNELSLKQLSNRGSPAICIAVLDGPVDIAHPCFEGANLTHLSTLLRGE